MKTIKTIVFFIGLILTSMFGCTRQIPAKIEPEYFPNQIGDSWSYSVYDSVSNQSEALNIYIINGTTNYSVVTTTWLLKYKNFNDTLTVSNNNGSITFQPKNSVKRTYLTPFSVNQTWNESYFSTSSSKVIAKENVTVEAGDFTDVYVIERNIFSLNYHLYEKVYFKPEVGIIKIYSKENNLGPIQIKTWELKTYYFYEVIL